MHNVSQWPNLRYQKSFNKKLTVNYISYVDEGLIKISNLYYGALVGQGAKNKPREPSAKFGTTVQCYVYYYPAGCS